jgi:hypothetical protein
MKRFLLSASVAACLLAGSAHGQVPSPQYAAKASRVLATTPLFSVNGLTLLPIGIKHIGDADWYVLCAQYPHGENRCLQITDTAFLKGLEVSSSTGADGTPLVWFLQTENMSSEQADKQSYAITVFNERLAQVVAQFANPRASAPTASDCASLPRRAGREARSSAGKDCGTGGDADPDPAQASAPRTANMQQVEVPGQRPDPEYPTFDPPFSDPAAPPPPDDPGSYGNDPPEQPDGAARRVKPLTETCVASPPPFIGIGCKIKVAKPPPLPDPDANPPPVPPAPDWCAAVPALCTFVNEMPTPDPRKAACVSKFIVDGVGCIDKRVRGKYDHEQEMQCFVVRYAEAKRCEATLGVPLATGTQ